MMTGFGMGFGGLWMILVWLVIIGGGIWLLAALFPRHQANKSDTGEQSDESALAILQQRYARGELTHQEFEAIRRDLERA
jgi:putative membrane protein